MYDSSSDFPLSHSKTYLLLIWHWFPQDSGRFFNWNYCLESRLGFPGECIGDRQFSLSSERGVEYQGESINLAKKNIICNMWNHDSIHIGGPFLARICQEIIVWCADCLQGKRVVKFFICMHHWVAMALAALATQGCLNIIDVRQEIGDYDYHRMWSGSLNKPDRLR